MDCKNCNTSLSENTNYCLECGARVIRNRLTIKNLFQHFSETFFNYDNKIIKTFVHLFTKPEVVIGGYINGLRKRYINVIQYFAISLTLTGLQFFILNTFYENPFDFDSSAFGLSQNVPNPESVDQYFETVSKLMGNYYSLMYIFSVPISAIATWLAYLIYNKAYNFTEHIIINTYYSAQLLILTSFFSVIFATMGINYLDFTLITTPLIFIYLWYILKRLYNLSFLYAMAYFLVYVFLYALLFGFLAVLGGIVGVFIGMALK